MPHGTPDWGLVDKAQATFGLDDVGEAVVRLGSIVTFDRRGDVVFLDDFACGLSKWFEYVVDVGGDTIPITHPVRSNPLALLIRTNDSEAAQMCIYRSLPFPVLGGVGVEFSFAIDEYLDRLDLTVRVEEGLTALLFEFRYNHLTGVLEAHNADNLWPDIVTITPVYDIEYTFNTIKMVFDLASEQYIRLIWNEVEYDLTAWSGYRINSVTSPRIQVQIYALCASDDGTDMIVDDVIVTQNEPIDILG